MSDEQPNAELPAVVQPDRDSRGWFLPGHRLPGPGRPRGIDIRKLAETRAAKDGTDLEAELWAILLKQSALAKAGDTNAAKFVFGFLAAQDPTELHVTQTDNLTDTERSVRLEELLRLAVERRRAAKLEGNGHTTP